MPFLIGFLGGFALGFMTVSIISPGENHRPSVGRSGGAQRPRGGVLGRMEAEVRHAWEEAQVAAREAETEMRAELRDFHGRPKSRVDNLRRIFRRA